VRDLVGLVGRETEIIGLNVTIPYKQEVIRFLTDMDDTARRVGAVNTILIKGPEGRRSMYGYNTDVYGFRQSLLPLLKPDHAIALVLGSGGASRAVEFVLKELGISCTFVSRNPSENLLGYEDLNLKVMDAHKLIINTTPLGTFPDIDACPNIPYPLLTPRHVIYDLVYNPAETRFLRLGREQGATTMNGLKMLELQAEASWNIWTGSQQV
jgi:shikimate dehydrogenase